MKGTLTRAGLDSPCDWGTGEGFRGADREEHCSSSKQDPGGSPGGGEDTIVCSWGALEVQVGNQTEEQTQGACWERQQMQTEQLFEGALKRRQASGCLD